MDCMSCWITVPLALCWFAANNHKSRSILGERRDETAAFNANYDTYVCQFHGLEILYYTYCMLLCYTCGL